MLQIFKDAETIGKEIGKKEGRLEAKKETAVNLLKDGFTVEQVVRATGLSKEEVEKLKSELKE